MPTFGRTSRLASGRTNRLALGLASCITAAILAASVSKVRAANATEQWQNDYIIFGRGTSLWRTDPRGKATARVVASLPEGRTASDVAILKTDAAGRVLLAEIASQWYWLALDSSQPKLQALACGIGGAELAPQANFVVCASTKRGTAIIRLADSVVITRDVPSQGARLITEGSGLDLIWADKNGVWRAPLAKPKQIIKVAGSAPSTHFSVSPDGSRAVGSFDNPPHGQMLFGFALDGIAARRKGIKAGNPLNWSHDGMWILVQDGSSACLMRTLGGQYKCWKGYVAGAAAPDGHWQLMFGNEPAAPSKASKGGRSAKGKAATKTSSKSASKTTSKDKKAAAQREANQRKLGSGAAKSGNDKLPGSTTTASPTDPADAPVNDAPTTLPDDAPDGGQDESGDDEPDADGHSSDGAIAAAATTPLGKGPHNLYRGQLDGAFTDPPALVVNDVDGAVVWVPMRTPAITSALPKYAPRAPGPSTTPPSQGATTTPNVPSTPGASTTSPATTIAPTAPRPTATPGKRSPISPAATVTPKVPTVRADARPGTSANPAASAGAGTNAGSGSAAAPVPDGPIVNPAPAANKPSPAPPTRR